MQWIMEILALNSLVLEETLEFLLKSLTFHFRFDIIVWVQVCIIVEICSEFVDTGEITGIFFTEAKELILYLILI